MSGVTEQSPLLRFNLCVIELLESNWGFIPTLYIPVAYAVLAYIKANLNSDLLIIQFSYMVEDIGGYHTALDLVHQGKIQKVLDTGKQFTVTLMGYPVDFTECLRKALVNDEIDEIRASEVRIILEVMLHNMLEWQG